MNLKVRVIPNAKKTELRERREDEWVLRLNAPAIEGKGNNAAVGAIAKYLDLPRSCVTLIAGEKSRHKIFEIVGLDVSDVERRLAECAR